MADVPRLHGQGRLAEEIQRGTKTGIERSAPEWLRDGSVYLPGIELAAGVELTIPHKLGRTPRDWIMTGPRASSAATEMPVETHRDSRVLRLLSAVDIKIGLVVF